MPQQIILVLNDPEKCDQVCEAWLGAGVTGITMVDSTGLAHHVGRSSGRDDLPMLPSLKDLLRGREEPHRTLYAIVQDDLDIDALVAATEDIIGSLTEPETGILFAIPVTRVWGLYRKLAQSQKS